MKLFHSLFIGLVLSLSQLTAEEKPPNVVLIFADDLGYGDLGCYGATKVKTPNIDKLAAEGRKFRDAHSASAVCTPSRYGLLTGEYPFRANGGKGLWGPAPITSPLIIDTQTNTIADVFKKSGYDTAVFGKWHLGFKDGRNDWQEPLRPGPQDLGFDYYFGMPVVNSAPPYVYVENDKIVGADPEDPLTLEGRGAKNVTPITAIPPEAAQRSRNQFSGAIEAHKFFNDFEVGTKLTEKATEWIRARYGKPFFAYFSTTNVHHPFTPAKRFQGTSEAGWYGDFVHELDWIVGEVMASLEESGVADNTLVIFTSDNGGMFNHGGRAAAKLGHKINGDLLGSKFGIWEGGHRVPFIARWPGKIEAGTVSDQLLCSVDLIASFAALTGQELEDPKDSINMLPALTGDPEKKLRTEMFMTPNKQSHMALRRGKWMFIPAKSDGGFRGGQPNQHAWGGASVAPLVGTPNSDIENGKIKPGAPPAQLYDLEADVNQTKNVYYDNLDLANEMAAAIREARQDAGFKAGAATPTKAAGSANDGGPPLKKYDDFKPVGNIHYSFESGTLGGWEITDGKLGEPVTGLPALAARKEAPFARHGSHHLSTLVVSRDKPLADTQTGVVKSPAFKLTGDKVAFLVAGGFDKKDLYVALVDAESGDILKQSGGSRDHRMRRVVWDVAKWKDKTVRFEVVDRVTGGWGHLNVDDFSAQGEPAEAELKPPAPPQAAATKPKKVDPPRDPSTKPNVIFILMDDMGYSDVSCYGAKKVDTPNIDKMAAEGLQFTSFHTAASICSPSRAAFLTGAYPQRNGLYMGINENREAHWFLGLNPDEITLAEQFKKQGYKTLMVGKWHLGTEEKFSYYNQGFDHYYGATSNMGHNPEFLDEQKLVYKRVDITKLSELYTKRVVKHIEDNRDAPFFLYFSHNYPHTPIKPGKAFENTSKGGPRGDAIQEIDWGIGEMLKALEANGILENTLVIFTSDNGATSQEFSAPYRGTKYVTLEGGHRVPFILYWKGMIQEPAVLDVPVNAMDLFPTLSELIGEALPSDRKYDGVSLTPLFKGEPIARDPNEPFYYYNCENLQAVRVGDWKLELPRTVEQMPWWNRRAKPVENPRLYHLKSDKAERTDLSSANPDKVAELQKLAETTREKLGEFMERGTEQRPTGSLFPEVPIMSNQKQDWDPLSDEVKGRAKTEFKKVKREK